MFVKRFCCEKLAELSPEDEVDDCTFVLFEDYVRMSDQLRQAKLDHRNCIASLRHETAKKDTIMAICTEMIDDDPCEYDMNAFCQTHYHKKPCPHERAKELLKP